MLRFHADSKEMVLATTHPGVTVEEILDSTGWDLKVSEDVGETPAPTEAELALLTQFDPQGFWTGRA